MERISAADERILALSTLLPQAAASRLQVGVKGGSEDGDDGEQARARILELAQRQGYAEGMRRAAEEVQEAAAAAKREVEAAHAEEGSRLRVDRERLAALLRGIPHEIAAIEAQSESVVLEAAFAAVLRVVGRTASDEALIRTTCLQALDEYRVRPAVLRLAPGDAEAIAGAVTAPGVRIEPDPALAPGECRLETHKGQYATGLAIRLEALKHAFLQGSSGAPA